MGYRTGYRLDWRLVGRDNRLLDSGEIDSGFWDRRSALEALGASDETAVEEPEAIPPW